MPKQSADLTNNTTQSTTATFEDAKSDPIPEEGGD